MGIEERGVAVALPAVVCVQGENELSSKENDKLG